MRQKQRWQSTTDNNTTYSTDGDDGDKDEEDSDMMEIIDSFVMHIII